MTPNISANRLLILLASSIFSFTTAPFSHADQFIALEEPTARRVVADFLRPGALAITYCALSITGDPVQLYRIRSAKVQGEVIGTNTYHSVHVEGARLYESIKNSIWGKSGVDLIVSSTSEFGLNGLEAAPQSRGANYSCT